MKKAAKTNRSGKVLEYVFEQLAHYGFQQINGKEMAKIKVLPPRYVHTHAEYKTLWGTTGYHEGVIIADKQNRNDFIQNNEIDYADLDHVEAARGQIMIVVECKFQSGSGSVDEKIPYILQSAEVSAIPNWILVLDGDWWIKNKRGQAVVQYAKHEAEQIAKQMADKRVLVLLRREFKELVLRAWGKTDG